MPQLTSAKIVIRCQDYLASYNFYSSVLRLVVIDQWDEQGGKGCIFHVGEHGFIEIYKMDEANPRYHSSFSQLLSGDKIDVQLHTESLDEWADWLKGLWPFEGPEELPWGQRWIKLRDPDNLLIAIYEGQV